MAPQLETVLCPHSTLCTSSCLIFANILVQFPCIFPRDLVNPVYCGICLPIMATNSSSVFIWKLPWTTPKAKGTHLPYTTSFKSKAATDFGNHWNFHFTDNIEWHKTLCPTEELYRWFFRCLMNLTLRTWHLKHFGVQCCIHPHS